MTDDLNNIFHLNLGYMKFIVMGSFFNICT